MVGGPLNTYPECSMDCTREAVEFFTQDEGVTAFASMEAADLDQADALVVPGGFPDVDPAGYGEGMNGTHLIEPSLDRDQYALIARAVEKHLPILGICRGHQLVSVYFGATMIQNIGCRRLHRYKPGSPQFHTVYNLPESRIYSAYGEETITNTVHHQALRRLPDCLRITQFWCEDPALKQETLRRLAAGERIDGTDELIIEAVEHRSYPFLGVQWHPELGGELFRPEAAKIRALLYGMIDENALRSGT